MTEVGNSSTMVLSPSLTSGNCVSGDMSESDMSMSGSWDFVLANDKLSSTDELCVEEDVQELLKFKPRSPLKIDTSDKEVVVVLGKTLSGKSTLIQFIAGNDINLVSEEDVPGGSNFLIRGKGHSGRTTLIGEMGTSTTMFPSIIKDERNNLAFCDCPGFGDTRGPLVEIQQIFEIKEILETSRRIKLAVVLEYHNIVGGGTVDDFLTLLESVGSLVPNLNKYSSAICLVVSKVTPSFRKEGGTFVMVSDDVVLQQIVKFLTSVKVALLSPENLHMESSMRGKCEELVNLLLQARSSDSKPLRLGLFRQPDESGPVSEVKLLQDGKEALEQLLFRSTVSVEPESRDFGFPLSPRCRVALDRAIRELHKDIVRNAEHVAVRMKESVFSLLRTDRCPEDALETLLTHSACLLAVSDLLCFGSRLPPLCHCYADVQVQVVAVQGHLERVRYFQKVAPEDVVGPIFLDLEERFQGKLERVLKDRLSFYKWLAKVRDWLCSYSVQVARNKYNVRDIRDWGQGNPVDQEEKEPILLTDQKELLYFLRHVCSSQMELQDYMDIMNNIPFDGAMKAALNVILQEALSHEPHLERDVTEGCLLVKGSFVSLKEILDKVGERSELDQLIIVARHTVFFDVDVEETGRSFKMAVLAPRWEVIGDGRYVCLTGEAGRELPPKIGKAGRPGLPGGPGGAFLGVGETFVNGSRLHVSCCGGKGGPGEAGVPGKEGEKGKDAEPAVLFGEPSAKNVSSSNWLVTLFYNRRRDLFEGFDGERGENGQDGGAAGLGGPRGSIAVYQMTGESICMTARDGAMGVEGPGGPGGLGGLHGHSFTADLNLVLFIPFVTPGEQLERKGRGEAGDAGVSGANALGRVKSHKDKARVFGRVELAAIGKEFCAVLNDTRIMRSSMADRLVGREVRTQCPGLKLVTAPADDATDLPGELFSSVAASFNEDAKPSAVNQDVSGSSAIINRTQAAPAKSAGGSLISRGFSKIVSGVKSAVSGFASEPTSCCEESGFSVAV